MFAFVVSAILALLVWATFVLLGRSRGGDFAFIQLHHEYWGQLGVLAGLLLWTFTDAAPLLCLAGNIVAWDDTLEQMAQYVFKDNTLASPMRQLFYWAFHD